MFRRCRRFAAIPESHLAAVRAVENVAFHSRRGLIASRDTVRRMFHELREVAHRLSFARNPSTRK
jgi:hypothetical protein